MQLEDYNKIAEKAGKSLSHSSPEPITVLPFRIADLHVQTCNVSNEMQELMDREIISFDGRATFWRELLLVWRE